MSKRGFDSVSSAMSYIGRKGGKSATAKKRKASRANLRLAHAKTISKYAKIPFATVLQKRDQGLHFCLACRTWKPSKQVSRFRCQDCKKKGLTRK